MKSSAIKINIQPFEIMLRNPFTKPRTIIIHEIGYSLTLSDTFGEGLYLGDGCEKLGDYKSPPTTQQTLEFIPLTNCGRATEIFTSFKTDKEIRVDIEHLAITTTQLCVIRGSLQHGDLLLIKAEIDGKKVFFVAVVRICPDGSFDLSVELANGNGVVLSVGNQSRVVVPQLNTL